MRVRAQNYFFDHWSHRLEAGECGLVALPHRSFLHDDHHILQEKKKGGGAIAPMMNERTMVKTKLWPIKFHKIKENH